MKNKKNETLEDILAEGREFDEEQWKAREEKTKRMFKIFIVCVLCAIAVMVILGVFFNA